MQLKDKSIPIYKQISAHIEYLIASGKIQPGSKLSSIREFALKYKVNPNTVVRALETLEQQDLIYTDRTNGKYVINDQRRLLQLRRQLAFDDTLTFIRNSKNLSMDLDETIRLLKQLWED